MLFSYLEYDINFVEHSAPDYICHKRDLCSSAITQPTRRASFAAKPEVQLTPAPSTQFPSFHLSLSSYLSSSHLDKLWLPAATAAVLCGIVVQDISF